MTITASHVIDRIKNSKSFEKILEKVNVITLHNGNCLAELEISEEHTNIFGALHGGFSAALIDNIGTFGLLSHKNGNFSSAPINLHTIYMQSAKAGDTIEINAQTKSVQETLAFLEVLIKNKTTGEILVKGNQTKYLKDAKDKSKIFVRM